MRSDGPAALWFKQATSRLHEALPAPLRRIIPLTFIGYAIINGSAFLLDMGVLYGVSHVLQLSHDDLKSTTGVLFTVGYAIASVYAFFLNRTLNFREHGDLGKQSGKYTAVIVSNYVIWILVGGTVLGWLGVPTMVARVGVACCEGIYIYVMLRLWVFPRRRGEAVAESPTNVTTQDEPAPPAPVA